MDRKSAIALSLVFICSLCHAFTDSLWIVAGGGFPGDPITVEVWLQYEGGGAGDSISSFDIPLTWDAMVCTLEALTIGPDFSAWMNVSRIDNQGTEGPPPVAKTSVSALTFGPPIGPPQVPRGTHLAATLYFRILNTVVPPDSTLVDTLMEAFTPPICLGFGNKNGTIAYTPLFSSDYIRALQYPCGDCNGDGKITAADATYLAAYLYRGGPEPLGEADVNVDSKITAADATYLVSYMYRGGPPPCEPTQSVGNPRTKP